MMETHASVDVGSSDVQECLLRTWGRCIACGQLFFLCQRFSALRNVRSQPAVFGWTQFCLTAFGLRGSRIDVHLTVCFSYFSRRFWTITFAFLCVSLSILCVGG